MSRIEVVAQAEGCRLAPGGLDACVALGCGDMRRCLNILQSTHMAFDEVSPDNVYQCTGAPRPADVEQMMGWLMGEDFTSAFNNMWGLMSERGLALQVRRATRRRAIRRRAILGAQLRRPPSPPPQDVLADLFKHVMCIEQKGTAMPLARLVASLADVEHRLAVGTSEKIQLAGVVGIFMQSKAAIIAAQA